MLSARRAFFCLIALVGSPWLLLGQRNRIPENFDPRVVVRLSGNINPKAQAQFDQGAAGLASRIERMTLMLRPSQDQQSALEKLLQEQQAPGSMNYRNWLTPEQYADVFGLSPADIGKLVSWLQSQGLTVEEVARGRNWIAFSGLVAQVQAAFRTEIHRYDVAGELHIANSNEPSVPAGFQTVVLGILGLDDFYPKPPRHPVNSFSIPQRLRPDFTSGSNNYLAPDDVATIYDLVPLYNLGYSGEGQSIAVIGQSDIVMSDINEFRAMFNLSATVPTKVPVRPVPPVGTNDLTEADLDLEWAGAVARNANLFYVYSRDATVAAMDAVNNNTAPIISYSFGGCEPQNSALEIQSLQQVAQQANAQGITWVASSGDAGAAACNSQTDTIANTGFAVNVPASIPEVTGVGGTEFNESGGTGPYWGNTNGVNSGSALSYIPETAWNDTASTLAASGGGMSIVFSKPAWQSGAGVPADGMRDVPDLALSASANHDGYIFCNNGSCASGNPSSVVAANSIVGGTSASAPVFAGILALLQQYQIMQGFQSKPGLGNVNPTLYLLAHDVSGVFHDITTGNNIVPCVVGTSPACTTGSFGYNAGLGYDLVTGLGSIDAWSLASAWHTSQCTYTLPGATTVSSHVSAFTLTIETQSNCPWTAWTNTNWITISSPTGISSASTSLLLASNNSTQQRTGTVEVAGQTFTLTQDPLIAPDLVITSLTGPSAAVIGGHISVTLAVDNRGSAAAPAFQVEIYFSTTPTITTSAIDTGSRCTVSSLAAGASTQCSISVAVPVSLPPGTWYLGAIADPTNQVVEQDKSNNARVADSGPVVATAPIAPLPNLSITKTHSGSFSQGQQGAVYIVTVSNAANAGPTSGNVTVTETLPSGLTLVSMSGSGWTCASMTCNRSDALAAGSSYPSLTVTVNVASTASSPEINQVSVSGGASQSASASDATTINVITQAPTPVLSLSQKTLNFGVSGSVVTSPQTIAVNFTNNAGVAWTVSSNQPNIIISPTSGSGNGQFQVRATDGANGTITVTAPGATASPQAVSVNVSTTSAGVPYGSFDTPVNNTAGVAGGVAVTGWALDNVQVASVGIYREPIGNEPTQSNGLVFIGNATFVAGARPDVEAAYPKAPLNYSAGWGYLLLTNFLPNNGGSPGPGNGTYKLHAIAVNVQGEAADLGTRSITVDNAHASKPFGTIDTPGQGGTASGSSYVNFGWALTQNPYMIPTNGSTITAYLDGVPLGHPTYDNYRSDIATLFPGLANSNGAVGFFYIDTTALANGVHTISWSVTDNAGRSDGIGSRYFNVANTGGGNAPGADEPIDVAALAIAGIEAYSVSIVELERIELPVGANNGYLLVNGDRRPLPTGSTLRGGRFYWQPGPGFLGDYDLLFEQPGSRSFLVHVAVQPKSYKVNVSR
jgi:uncharacterized repeat protein (TIGR01451 family)